MQQNQVEGSIGLKTDIKLETNTGGGTQNSVQGAQSPENMSSLKNNSKSITKQNGKCFLF